MTAAAMASAPSLHGEITCNVCFEICENPQCLKCLHFFCNNCVQKIKQGKKIQCPDCRKISSMSEVKKDFRIQRLIDQFSHLFEEKDVKPISPTVCDVCKNAKKPVLSLCNICSEFLCSDCKIAHRGSRATEKHTLVDFLQLCDEKQGDFMPHINQIKDTKTKVQNNTSSAKSLLKQIQESEGMIIEKINNCRDDIKNRADQHHDKLIDEVKSLNKAFHDTLKETVILSEQCEQKLEHKVISLSQVSESQNYSLMMDTLSNLSQQIEKDLQTLLVDLPEANLDLLSTISVVKGDGFDPEKSTGIKVTHSTVKTKKMKPHAMVGGTFFGLHFTFQISLVQISI